MRNIKAIAVTSMGLVGLLSVAVGCGKTGGVGEVPDRPNAQDSDEDERWQCASSPRLEAGDHNGNGYRLEIRGDGGEAVAEVHYETVHEGIREAASFGPESWDVEFIEDLNTGELEIVAEELHLEASATRIDGVYRGTLVFDEDDSGEEQQLDAACWRSGFEVAYTYDEATGQCSDGFGNEGRVELPVITVRETGRGECVDFGEKSLNEELLGYPSLRDWNLRGAELNSASLQFADLVDADLAGASMSGFTYGYASIVGTIDEHTELPDHCEADGDFQIDCAR